LVFEVTFVVFFLRGQTLWMPTFFYFGSACKEATGGENRGNQAGYGRNGEEAKGWGPDPKYFDARTSAKRDRTAQDE